MTWNASNYSIIILVKYKKYKMVVLKAASMNDSIIINSVKIIKMNKNMRYKTDALFDHDKSLELLFFCRNWCINIIIKTIIL